MFCNIVSFPSSPDIQNCIYQFYTHSVVFNFTMFIWSNTCSISALQCGIGYITCVEQNQSVFIWVFSDGISIQAYFSPISYCVSNIWPTDNYQILPLGIQFFQWIYFLHLLSPIYPKTTLSLRLFAPHIYGCKSSSIPRSWWNAHSMTR